MAKQKNIRAAVAVATGRVTAGQATGKVVSISRDWEDKNKYRVEIEVGLGTKGMDGPTNSILVSQAEAAAYKIGESVTIETKVQRAGEG